MADRRKKKKDKRKHLDEPPTKEEKAVATYLRFNCPTKSTMFHGEEVHYFTGSKAVDCLVESKWSTGKRKTPILFTNRNSVLDYMQILLEKGLFFRAKKLVPKKKEKDADKDKNGDKKEEKGEEKKEDVKKVTDSPAVTKSPKKKRKGKEGDETEDGKDKEVSTKDDDESGTKKKKKIKLEFHQEQICKDSNDVYVWHFEPTSWTKFLIGLLIVIGSIAVCLFPLWPPWVRLGIYYCSLVAMGFVGFLAGLIVLRGIVFGVVWLGSYGQHHLWILPNLTEDCGFFESFKPRYSYQYHPRKSKEEEEEERRKKEEETEKETEKRENEEENVGGTSSEGEKPPNSEEEGDGTGEEGGEEEGLRRRRKPAKDENGFEVLETPDEDDDE